MDSIVITRIVHELDEQIQTLQTAKNALLAVNHNGNGKPGPKAKVATPKKNRMSAAGRERLRLAMKKRWREAKKAGKTLNKQ